MFKSRNQTTPQQPIKLALARFQHFCRIKKTKTKTKILYTPLQSNSLRPFQDIYSNSFFKLSFGACFCFVFIGDWQMKWKLGERGIWHEKVAGIYMATMWLFNHSATDPLQVVLHLPKLNALNLMSLWTKVFDKWNVKSFAELLKYHALRNLLFFSPVFYVW